MRLRTLSGSIPTPVAGQGFSYQFSPNERVKLDSLIFTFATSATVADRLVWAQIMDPNGVPTYETGSATAVAASSASDYVLSPVFSSPAAMQGPINAAVGLGLPNTWLPPGWRIAVGAVAIDPADQFSAITFAAHYSEDAWHHAEDKATWAAALAAIST